MKRSRTLPKETYSLSDLCGMFSLTARQIQDLRTKGALPGPEGVGRGSWYTNAHVQRLGAIKPLLDAGVSVTRIATRFAPAEVKSNTRDLELNLEGLDLECWHKVRIGADLQIGLCVSGKLEPLREALLRALVQVAKDQLSGV